MMARADQTEVLCRQIPMQRDGVQLYGAIARLELSHDFVHRATPVQDASKSSTNDESGRGIDAVNEEMTPRRESSETIALLSVENKELHDEHDVRRCWPDVVCAYSDRKHALSCPG